MSAIDQHLILHLAALAKLELSDSEQAVFAGQLGEILDYFKQLQALDTQDIPITSQTIDLVNITRADEIKNCDEQTQAAILNNAPQSSGRYFKVNKIL